MRSQYGKQQTWVSYIPIESDDINAVKVNEGL